MTDMWKVRNKCVADTVWWIMKESGAKPSMDAIVKMVQERVFIPSGGNLDDYSRRKRALYQEYDKIENKQVWITDQLYRFSGDEQDYGRLRNLVGYICECDRAVFDQIKDMQITKLLLIYGTCAERRHKIEQMAIHDNYVPAIRLLVNSSYRWRRHCDTFRYLDMLYKNGATTVKELNLIGWYYFFGLGTIQSYPRAVSFGISPELCRVGEFADFHLLVPIGLLYRFIGDVKFLLSLRLVCKSWNNRIQNCNIFWNHFFNGKIYKSTIEEKQNLYIFRKMDALDSVKRTLKGKETRLKERKKRLAKSQMEIAALEEDVIRMKREAEDMDQEMALLQEKRRKK